MGNWFLIGFILNFFKNCFLNILMLLMLFLGIWIKPCLMVGLVLLGVNIILSFILELSKPLTTRSTRMLANSAKF